MINKYNDSDWLSDYIIINNKKKYITDIESNLIDKRYSYNETTWEFEKWQEAIDFEKQTLISQIETITNELVALNWRIKGWEELVEMWVADEDDLADIERYKLEATEFINKRVELKAELKLLT